MDKTVGIIGLGLMGGAIARNLRNRGWRVIGFDILREPREEFVAAGGTLAESGAAVAQVARIVLTSLPSPAAALAVAAEIAASFAQQRIVGDRIVVETSTLALEDKAAFAEALPHHITLDCPLSGTAAQARRRDLVVYASGDPHAIAEAMPVFADFSRETHDLGAFGNGSRMKFIANLLVAVHNVAAAEAMTLAKRAGLDPHLVVRVAGAGAGHSRMFELRAPMMAQTCYEPATMRVATWKKDMEIIGRFARELDCPTPLFLATEPIYAEALERGLGDKDTAAVFAILDAKTAS
jgi:putative dehydrogenase